MSFNDKDKAKPGAVGCEARLEPENPSYSQYRSLENVDPFAAQGELTSKEYLRTRTGEGGVLLGIYCSPPESSPEGLPKKFAFANWFAAGTPSDPQHKLMGAVDFFMRINVPLSAAPRISVLKLTGDKVGLELSRKSRGVSTWTTDLALIDGLTKGFEVLPGDGTNIVQSATAPAFDLPCDAAMHVAIVFRTNDLGVVEMRTYLQPDTGAIDTTKPATAGAYFDLLEFVNDFAFPADDAFSFGVRVNGCDVNGAVTVDFDELRIWSSAPELLPGILDL